jgi:hypothetical protein
MDIRSLGVALAKDLARRTIQISYVIAYYKMCIIPEYTSCVIYTLQRHLLKIVYMEYLQRHRITLTLFQN